MCFPASYNAYVIILFGHVDIRGISPEQVGKRPRTPNRCYEICVWIEFNVWFGTRIVF